MWLVEYQVTRQSEIGVSEGCTIKSGISSTAGSQLAGKRAGMVVFSRFPADPRPRRAAEALLSQGMRLDLICEHDVTKPNREVRENFEILRIPIEHRRSHPLSYAYQYAAFTLYSAIVLAWRSLRQPYDLIYVHNMPDVLVLCALIPKLLGAKVILDQHDPMPELLSTIYNLDQSSFAHHLIRYLEKWSIKRADLVITVSETFKKVFAARSCGPEKIQVIINAPDANLFPFRPARSYPRRTPGQPLILMYHGLLENRNGLHVAVDALSLLRGRLPVAELRIYGKSTPYLERVMANVKALGLSEKIHYLGPKDLEELANEIENCDVGIVPSPSNAFTQINTPTRILEYLALGKPVIAPSTQGVRDYFTGDSLFFFEAGNAQELAEQIEHVAFHSADAVATAERGQELYCAYAWELEKQRLVSLVAQLIGSNGRSPALQ
ncbi:MAG TPA: glycosyltransferase family 4 protein [Terracidiphilus sp.]|nr:glycosyltransferase family 4 protein [Terracidiphilus sp.]